MGQTAHVGLAAFRLTRDIMLPKVNGYEICRTVRECGLEMPIIMLTAKGQEEDIVLGQFALIVTP